MTPQRRARRRRAAAAGRRQREAASRRGRARSWRWRAWRAIATGTVLSTGAAPRGGRSRRCRAGLSASPIAAREAQRRREAHAGASARLIEEDPTLSLEQNAELQEMVLWGQGDIHLQIAMDRLKHQAQSRRSCAQARRCPTRRRSSAARSSIRASSAKRRPRPVRRHPDRGEAAAARHRPQLHRCGGGRRHPAQLHPRGRGRGDGVSEARAARLSGGGRVGQRSSPASSTRSTARTRRSRRRRARRMSEAMPKCDPVLLEPIHHVEISVPNAFTSRVQRIVSGRRGQILGFDAKPGWPGWDVVTAHMPRRRCTISSSSCAR